MQIELPEKKLIIASNALETVFINWREKIIKDLEKTSNTNLKIPSSSIPMDNTLFTKILSVFESKTGYKVGAQQFCMSACTFEVSPAAYAIYNEIRYCVNGFLLKNYIDEIIVSESTEYMDCVIAHIELFSFAACLSSEIHKGYNPNTILNSFQDFLQQNSNYFKEYYKFVFSEEHLKFFQLTRDIIEYQEILNSNLEAIKNAFKTFNEFEFITKKFIYIYLSIYDKKFVNETEFNHQIINNNILTLKTRLCENREFIEYWHKNNYTELDQMQKKIETIKRLFSVMQNLFKTTGWVAILRGDINIEVLKKYLNDFFNDFKEFQLRHQKSISAKKIEGAIKSFDFPDKVQKNFTSFLESISKLGSYELLSKVADEIQGSILDLKKISEEVGISLVNVKSISTNMKAMPLYTEKNDHKNMLMPNEKETTSTLYIEINQKKREEVRIPAFTNVSVSTTATTESIHRNNPLLEETSRENSESGNKLFSISKVQFEALWKEYKEGKSSIINTSNEVTMAIYTMALNIEDDVKRGTIILEYLKSIKGGDFQKFLQKKIAGNRNDFYKTHEVKSLLVNTPERNEIQRIPDQPEKSERRHNSNNRNLSEVPMLDLQITKQESQGLNIASNISNNESSQEIVLNFENEPLINAPKKTTNQMNSENYIEIFTYAFFGNGNNYAKRLCDFSKSGDVESIKRYYKKNCNVNYLTSGVFGTVAIYLGQYSPLMMACAFGKIEVVKLLIEHYNADVNLCGGRFKNISPLDCAILYSSNNNTNDYQEIVVYLKSKDALTAAEIKINKSPSPEFG